MNFTRNYCFKQLFCNIKTILGTNFSGIVIPLVTKSGSQIKAITTTSFDNRTGTFIPISLVFSIPFFSKDEETPEQKLINTIKRSILCIQREEYSKAERMLHLALRMAQDQQHRDGITYVYDIMANLAMEQEQFPKAEKLFADVMKRLFADGYKENDIKILHISLKLAHMAHLQENLQKAVQGFTWTLENIQKNLKKLPDDEDMQQLWGIAQNWYAQCLMDEHKYNEAKKCFLNAYDIYTAKYGKLNEEAILILNNLSVACSQLGDLSGAKKFLEEGIQMVKQLPDSCELVVLQANLGLLYLQMGLIDQAKEECSSAWKKGKICNHRQTIEQASICLDKIKALKV